MSIFVAPVQNVRSARSGEVGWVRDTDYRDEGREKLLLWLSSAPRLCRSCTGRLQYE